MKTIVGVGVNVRSIRLGAANILGRLKHNHNTFNCSAYNRLTHFITVIVKYSGSLQSCLF